jgi:serine/threonine protein kinase
MFSQMCEAVAQCHRRGVYHRDIKVSAKNAYVSSRNIGILARKPYRH